MILHRKLPNVMTILVYLVVLKRFSRAISSSEYIKCNRMEYHETGHVYPGAPTINRYILFDENVHYNKTFIQWIVNRTVKTEVFRAYHLQSGKELWDCELLRPGAETCCIENIGMYQVAQLASCDHRVYYSQIKTYTYNLVYEYRGQEDFDWDDILVYIYYRTPDDKPHRFFSKYPGKLNDLVCSEIAKSGHESSPPHIAQLISTPEQHTITYADFESKILYITPGDQLILKVKAFIRPNHVLKAFLFRIDNTSLSLEVTSCEQLYVPLPIVFNVSEFTERVQIFTDHINHIKQVVLKCSVTFADRALVLMTQAVGSWDHLDLRSHMKKWLIDQDFRATFLVNLKSYSPGIRVLQLRTAHYSVIKAGNRFQIAVTSVQPVNTIQCFKASADGTFRRTDRMVFHENSLSIEEVRQADTGLYYCIESKTREKLLHEHRLIVLPVSSDVSLKFTDDTIMWPERGEPLVYTGTVSFPNVRCELNAPDGYDSYEGFQLIHQHDEGVGSTKFLQDSVNQTATKYEIRNARRILKFDYEIDPCGVESWTMMTHRFVCLYRYSPTASATIGDMLQNDSVQAERFVHFVAPPHENPFFVSGSIQSNLPQIYQSMLNQVLARSYNLFDLFIRSDPPEDRDALKYPIEIHFRAVHWSSPHGWVHVFLLPNPHESSHSISCLVNITSESPNHVISRSTFIKNLDVFDKIVNYKANCLLEFDEPLMLALVVFNSEEVKNAFDIENINKEFEKKLRAAVMDYEPNKEDLHHPHRIPYISEIGIHHAHLIVPFQLAWEVDGDEKLWPHPGPTFAKNLWRTRIEGLFDHFEHHGEELCSSSKFHKSGPSKRIHETVAKFQMGQFFKTHEDKSVALTFYQLKGDIYLEECYTTDLNIHQKLLSSNTDLSIEIRGKYFAVGTYSCVLQPEHVALVFINYANSSESTFEPMKQRMVEQLKKTIRYWLRHPESLMLLSPMGVRKDVTSRVLWDFRIQRLFIGWYALVPSGSQWQMLIHSPYYWSDVSSSWTISCYTGTRSTSLVYQYFINFVDPTRKPWWNSTNAGVDSTNTYSCFDHESLLLAAPRRLTVLPTAEESMQIIFSETLISSLTILMKMFNEQSEQKFYSLKLDEPGYVYCRSILHEYETWKSHVRIKFGLIALKNDTRKTYERPATQIKIENFTENIIVYSIRQTHWDEQVSHLEAKCVLWIAESILDERDLRDQTVLHPLTVWINLFLNYTNLVTIYPSLIKSGNKQLEVVLSLLLADQNSRIDFQMSPNIELAPQSVIINVTAALLNNRGHLWMNLFVKNKGHSNWENCSQIGEKIILTSNRVPDLLLQIFKNETNLKLAHVYTFIFNCTLTLKHVMLTLFASRDGDPEGEERGKFLHLMESWYNFTASGLFVKDEEEEEENLPFSRNNNSMMIVKLKMREEHKSIPEPDEEAPPSLFTSEIAVISTFNEYNINCG